MRWTIHQNERCASRTASLVEVRAVNGGEILPNVRLQRIEKPVNPNVTIANEN
jgi:hypothetical protein